MKISYTTNFQKVLVKFERKDDLRVRDKIKRALRILESGNIPKGLRLHKVTTRHGAAWSISLDMKTRLIFTYVEEGVLLMDLGSHSQVY